MLKQYIFGMVQKSYPS